jgi:hypothetical protein
MDRYYCPLGPRTIRADVEYLRLAKENIKDEKIMEWLKNRALICDKIIEFYFNISQETMDQNLRKLSLDFLSYARSAQIVLWHAATGTPTVSIPIPSSLPPPRGEIIREIIRPLIKFSDIFPKYKLRIRHGIIESRAAAYGYSADKAIEELRLLHGITL